MESCSSGDEDSIRQELSHVPLGEIQKLRQEIGIKKYDATFHKQLHKTSNNVKDFKRTNKHRPRELSSKKPVTRFRQVVPVPKKEKKCDPRFDERCGHLNKDLFSKSYSFLSDVKNQEKRQLVKEIKETKYLPQKEKLQKLLQKIESSDVNREKEREKKSLEKEHKKVERELMKQGKKPFYISKAMQRKALLAKSYKELKHSGRLQKFLSKKRKRNAAKDRKKILKKI